VNAKIRSNRRFTQFMNYTNMFLAAQSLGSDQKTKDTMQEWLEGLAVTLFDEGMPKLVPRYEKCHNLHGDYVEKSFNVGTNMLQKDIIQTFLKCFLYPICSYFLDALRRPTIRYSTDLVPIACWMLPQPRCFFPSPYPHAMTPHTIVADV
jgi:hypothetical protein